MPLHFRRYRRRRSNASIHSDASSAASAESDSSHSLPIALADLASRHDVSTDAFLKRPRPKFGMNAKLFSVSSEYTTQYFDNSKKYRKEMQILRSTLETFKSVDFKAGPCEL